MEIALANSLRRPAAWGILLSLCASVLLDLYLSGPLSNDAIASVLASAVPGGEGAAHLVGRMLRMKAWPIHYAASVVSFALFLLLFRTAPRDAFARLLAAAMATIGVTGAVVTFTAISWVSALHHFLAWPVAAALCVYAIREATR